MMTSSTVGTRMGIKYTEEIKKEFHVRIYCICFLKALIIYILTRVHEVTSKNYTKLRFHVVPKSSECFVLNVVVTFEPGPAAVTALIQTSYSWAGLRPVSLYVIFPGSGVTRTLNTRRDKSFYIKLYSQRVGKTQVLTAV